ncbi:MAG: T9SS type A sorting domain-containing protein [Microscillaceae bacterium]|nr:T9SS type A sorting domain-containing protein [Microscillaceae bacterium]
MKISRLFIFLLFLGNLSATIAQTPREYTAEGSKPEFTPKTLEAFEKMANLKPISEVSAVGESQVSLLIYPNPYKRSISLEFRELVNEMTLVIYNQEGVIHIDVQGDGQQVQEVLNRQMRYLAAGEYTLKIVTKDKIYRRKLIIQQTQTDTNISSSQ